MVSLGSHGRLCRALIAVFFWAAFGCSDEAEVGHGEGVDSSGPAADANTTPDTNFVVDDSGTTEDVPGPSYRWCATPPENTAVCADFTLDECKELFPAGYGTSVQSSHGCCGCFTCDCGKPCHSSVECEGACVLCKGPKDGQCDLTVGYCWYEATPAPLGCWYVLDKDGEVSPGCGD